MKVLNFLFQLLFWWLWLMPSSWLVPPLWLMLLQNMPLSLPRSAVNAVWADGCNPNVKTT